MSIRNFTDNVLTSRSRTSAVKAPSPRVLDFKRSGCKSSVTVGASLPLLFRSSTMIVPTIRIYHGEQIRSVRCYQIGTKV